MANPIKIGIGGPVGAGKTQLIEKVVKRLSKRNEHRRYYK